MPIVRTWIMPIVRTDMDHADSEDMDHADSQDMDHADSEDMDHAYSEDMNHAHSNEMITFVCYQSSSCFASSKNDLLLTKYRRHNRHGIVSFKGSNHINPK